MGALGPLVFKMPSEWQCPVFYPTIEDVYGDFEAYIEKVEKKIEKFGVCKICMPASWTPRKHGYPDDLDLTIDRPIRQHATGSRGLYRMLLIEGKPMSLRDDFRPLALDKDNCPPSNLETSELERKFWKNVTMRPPLYGADVEGSLFDEKTKVQRKSSLCGSVLAIRVFM